MAQIQFPGTVRRFSDTFLHHIDVFIPVSTDDHKSAYSILNAGIARNSSRLWGDSLASAWSCERHSVAAPIRRTPLAIVCQGGLV